MSRRVLIVGTVPYNKRSTSRAFESYFHGWEKKDLAQVFSHAKAPTKGHCDTFYQITDYRVLKKRMRKLSEAGIVYYDKDLMDEWNSEEVEIDNKAYKKVYKFGKRKTALTHYLRKLLWNKKSWCTKQFNEWLDKFNPECVFLSFSDDFFILQIALYVAKRFNIPIVSSIGDDYYFNNKFSLYPFYWIYRTQYKRLVRKVLSIPGSAIYIGDKIRDKYNKHFDLDGETVYLTSELKRREFVPINMNNPLITYCGNIRCGRYLSLLDIATALGEINPKYKIDVYTGENDEKFNGALKEHPNVNFNGAIPYNQVLEVTAKSDMVLVVEGWRKKDVLTTKYSLSTKVADALTSGANVFAYGDINCGAIEYLEQTNACGICIRKENLIATLRCFLEDKELQEKCYNNSKKAAKNHILENSCAVFRGVVEKAIKNGEKNER